MIDLSQTGLSLHRATDVPITQFQVLGERGSGTNVVRKTMEKNLRLMRVEGLGWKHGFPHMVCIPDDLLVVCVVRNAAAWALSMHKRPWHVAPEVQALGFSEFLRAEWRSVVDRPPDFEMLSDELHGQGATLQYDRHPITGLPFENLFRLRTAKLRALEGIANRGCSFVFVQLEVFHVLGEDYLHQLCEAFDVTRKVPHFKQVTRRLGNKWNQSVRNHRETPEEIGDADAEFMLSQLDPDLEARFGYVY
ncbi:hypothetical protein [Pseudaestuariivita atlantica]|uniref:Sulfotransferase domain-containing protein n=1 Tax=Pseudaestuariivita atlantica TaxID=1317121 RepID=A0A0L1JV68_9RHOB|nr:hypothetical protein [Pseudaestuariivita atlantica]KNG95661.1 hypothetical protein ATO11_01245 [Pseudaestuariivita atlantica]